VALGAIGWSAKISIRGRPGMLSVAEVEPPTQRFSASLSRLTSFLLCPAVCGRSTARQVRFRAHSGPPGRYLATRDLRRAIVVEQ